MGGTPSPCRGGRERLSGGEERFRPEGQSKIGVSTLRRWQTVRPRWHTYPTVVWLTADCAKGSPRRVGRESLRLAADLRAGFCAQAVSVVCQ